MGPREFLHLFLQELLSEAQFPNLGFTFSPCQTILITELEKLINEERLRS